MRKWLLTSLSVALIACGSVAYGAQKAKEPKEPKAPKPPKKTPVEVAFEKLDTNTDSQISLEEFCTGKDGKPLDAKAKEEKEKIFKRWDADGNGQVTMEEFKAKGAKPKKPK